jgi:hypothetical protein
MRKRFKEGPLRPICSIYLKVSSSIAYTSCSRSSYPRREASCSSKVLLSPGLRPSRVHKSTAEAKISRYHPRRSRVSTERKSTGTGETFQPCHWMGPTPKIPLWLPSREPLGESPSAVPWYAPSLATVEYPIDKV